MNGESWYSCSDLADGLVYHSATKADAVFRRLPVTALLYALAFGLAYALLSLLLLWGFTARRVETDGPEVLEDPEAMPQAESGGRRFAVNRFTVVLQNVQRKHVGRTPEQRTRFVFTLTAFFMLAGIFAALQISASRQDQFYIFDYVLNGKWTPGISLFAFAKILIISLGTAMGILSLRLITEIVCTLLQKRGETIWRLIASFIEYISILGLIFSACDSLGFDTRALLASVGILSLAVSLGARDLVADVLSGITLAFSGEYQIGEYVEIAGFRGWVKEIGVRSTVLVNNDGNIKNFCNRDVKNILNLSRMNCNYTIHVTIGTEQPLPKVEEMLNRELPRIARETPEIIKGPVYEGITGFSGSNVTISIATECKERNYGKVRRKVNREVRLLLEKNGITIK
ncbi:MAG: mechanosensitive ion channel family protein [Clostridia bacterium]|nr:mechanosensitive ion channel family protein [Clostridia bacterium]